ncbi:MAG: type I glutamate--ammonia ligase [Thermotogae bacterium]|nr:type I glutamate--ammonia ligase [Thermotogota bacterium]
MTKEEVLKVVESEGIKFIRLQFTDINGILKNVEIPADELPQVLDRGIMFDGSSIDGFVRIHESDMYLYPDPSTFAILPWSQGEKKSARLICDVYTGERKPFDGDPRYRLKLVVERAEEMGFTAFAGPEPEFFLLPRAEDQAPLLEFMDEGGYFDLLPVDRGEETRKDIVLALEKMGLDVETSHHEVAPSQHEIDFRYDNILRTADNIQTFKFVVKTVALMHGLHATFMPKPFFGVNGSGMHTHMSLFRGEENAFYDPDGPQQLSENCLYFIGGIIKHAKEITLITNPTVNSYKRLVPGYEAPVNIAWSAKNRSALVRVPAARGKGTRIEYRSPDPTCNAYLALAVMLAAGLEGIEKKIMPPNPVDANIFEMDELEKAQHNIESLPGSLKEAIEIARESELVRKTLGDHIFEKFIEMKEKEWKAFSIAVTDWEVARYLAIL